MLNLAATRRLLLSHWSSWEDIVVGMAAPDTPHEIGCKAVSAQAERTARQSARSAKLVARAAALEARTNERRAARAGAGGELAHPTLSSLPAAASASERRTPRAGARQREAQAAADAADAAAASASSSVSSASVSATGSWGGGATWGGAAAVGGGDSGAATGAAYPTVAAAEDVPATMVDGAAGVITAASSSSAASAVDYTAVTDDGETGEGNSLTSFGFSSVPEAGALGSRQVGSAGRWAQTQIAASGGGQGGGGGARRANRKSAAPSTAKGTDGADEVSAKDSPSTKARSGHEVIPGLTVRKLPSLAALPDKPGEVKVRVHKTKQFSAFLPKSVRDMRLVFLVPRHFKVSSLAARMQSMLKLETPPALHIWSATTHESNVELFLDADKTIGSYSDSNGDTVDGYLHISVDLPAGASQTER